MAMYAMAGAPCAMHTTQHRKPDRASGARRRTPREPGSPEDVAGARDPRPDSSHRTPSWVAGIWQSPWPSLELLGRLPGKCCNPLWTKAAKYGPAAAFHLVLHQRIASPPPV